MTQAAGRPMNLTDERALSHRLRRWPWLFSALLLLLAAAATAWSTYLFWLPCQGSMLEGSVFDRNRTGSFFSDACLRRMDAGMPFPFAPGAFERTPGSSEAAAAGMVLAGLAWVPLLLGLGWKRRTRYVAAAPVVVSLLLAAGCWVSGRAAGDNTVGDRYFWSVLGIELAVLVAAVLVWIEEEGLTGRSLARVVLLAWGASAFGLFHVAMEFGMMITFSETNWDVPPGTGYGIALVLAVSALGTAAITIGSDIGQPSAVRFTVHA